MSFESSGFNSAPNGSENKPAPTVRESFGYDSNPYAHLMNKENNPTSIPVNEDERGRTVIHADQARKADEFLKKYGSNTDGLTLQ